MPGYSGLIKYPVNSDKYNNAYGEPQWWRDLAVTTKAEIDSSVAAVAAEAAAMQEFTKSALVYDAFDRTNGSLRTPTTGGDAWSAALASGSTTGISVVGGTVKASSGTGNSYAWVPGEANVIVEATVAAIAGDPIAGLIARYTSPTDHLVVQLRASSADQTYTVFDRSSALTTLITSTVQPKVGDRFGMRVTGTIVQLLVNGAVIGSASTTKTAANPGVYFNGTDMVTAFDDFTVTGV